MPYCRAVIGSSVRMSAAILLISSTGKDSGLGFPAAKLMHPGLPRLLKISLMAEGFMFTNLSDIL